MISTLRSYWWKTPPSEEEKTPENDAQLNDDVVSNEETNEETLAAADNSSKAQLEEDLKNIISSAKDWSNFLYSKGKIVSENATKTVTSKAKYLADHVSESNLIDRAPLFGEFQREQERFIAEQRSKKLLTSDQADAVLPWSNCESEELAEKLRSQILDLSSEERHFLRKPPNSALFEFDRTSYHNAAKALLLEDGRLADMRRCLVPQKINEESFWCNYFYRISLLRQSIQLEQLNEALPNAATAGQKHEADVQDDPYAAIEAELQDFEMLSSSGGEELCNDETEQELNAELDRELEGL